MYNAMTQAFLNAGFKASKPHYVGKFQDGWKATLSFRTFKKLESEGYTKFSS